ncbi:MAG: toprim domain-containing protein [Nitrospiria bacterium]
MKKRVRPDAPGKIGDALMTDQLLKQEIYPRLTHQIIFSDRKMTLRGNGVIMDCPNCGKKKFYAYQGKPTGFCYVTSCGYKTNWWQYTQSRYGLDNKDTFRKLAELAGVPLGKKKYPSGDRKGALTLNTLHRDFYQWGRDQLLSRNGEAALTHLLNRGFTREEIEKKTEICAMPNRKGFLEQFLKKSSYTLNQIKESGLNSYGFGINYQLLFPHRNENGEIVTWAGRLTRPGQYRDGEELPKYKNAPGFSKEIPFGYSSAKTAIFQSKQAILVEGFMDAAHCHAKGFHNVVAILGSRLLAHQLPHIKSAGAKQVLLCLDRDADGQKGSEMAMELFLQHEDISPYFMILPPDCKDADETLKKYGKDEFGGMIKAAQPGWLWYAEKLAERYDNSVNRDDQLNHFGTIYSRIEDAVMKDEFIKKLSQKTKIGILTLRRRFRCVSEAEPSLKKQTVAEGYLKAVRNIDQIWNTGMSCAALRLELGRELASQKFIPRDPVSIRFKSFLRDLRELSLKFNQVQSITQRIKGELLKLESAEKNKPK